MKAGTIAKDMLKDQKTIVAWANMREYQDWFSDRARGANGHADFDEGEYDVINTIRVLRNENLDPDQIAARLRDGYRSQEPPPGLATRSTTMPANVYANQVSATRENQELRTQLSEREVEVARLNQELQAMTERLMNERLRSEQALMSERMDREERLNRQIGKLEAQVEMLREQLDELKPSRQTGSDGSK